MNLATLFLAFLLTACGGGGSPVETAPPGSLPSLEATVSAYGDSTQEAQGQPHAASRPGLSVSNEGVGGTKKWERLDSYGPKFVENIVQATSRDILCYAMRTLRNCSIVMHIHDELVIEADPRMSLQAVCDQMGRTPPWAKGLLLRADGYETNFYKKD